MTAQDDYNLRRWRQHLGLWVAGSPFGVMLIVAVLFAADLTSLIVTLLTIGISSFLGFVGGMIWQANR